jgi:hypothetical protein
MSLEENILRDAKKIMEVLAFYADSNTYFEQPTLSGYKAAPIAKDQGLKARKILESTFQVDSSSDSKGAYP